MAVSKSAAAPAKRATNAPRKATAGRTATRQPSSANADGAVDAAVLELPGVSADERRRDAAAKRPRILAIAIFRPTVISDELRMTS